MLSIIEQFPDQSIQISIKNFIITPVLRYVPASGAL